MVVDGDGDSDVGDDRFGGGDGTTTRVLLLMMRERMVRMLLTIIAIIVIVNLTVVGVDKQCPPPGFRVLGTKTWLFFQGGLVDNALKLVGSMLGKEYSTIL